MCVDVFFLVRPRKDASGGSVRDAGGGDYGTALSPEIAPLRLKLLNSPHCPFRLRSLPPLEGSKGVDGCRL